ncbi:MAG: dehydrogenase [Epulopiscium sp. Nele67-Bin002]|nr:MAG: dehydrogenase [Epulopiscium sp. Nuni2H_MBin001]OON91384.1 MAG: dehydrogenase [Epulopiscium sp. Nele67-Bin002]
MEGEHVRIIVIGAVAAGTSAAAKARRNNDAAEIVIYEKDLFISYAICGMPYFIGGEVEDIDELTPRDVEFFKKKHNIDVFIGHEVIDVDVDLKTVTVKNLTTQTIIVDKYDKLVFSTGATVAKPNIEGLDKPNVFFLRTIANAQDIKHYIKVNNPKNAIVVGSGFVGFEIMENLMHLGVDVTLLDAADKLTKNLDADMAKYLEKILLGKNVKVLTSQHITQITDEGIKLANNTTLATDMIIMATGVRPNVDLAKSVGIVIGEMGGIKVDRHMKTNIDDVYACGDCIETFSRVTGGVVYQAMATVANKTGRIAGDNLTGGTSFYAGGLGTGIFKLFNYTIASTGINEAEAISLGYDIQVCHNIKPNKPLYMDGKEMVIKAIADKKFGRLLGVQIIGQDGVDKRIDVFATLITYEAKVQEIFDIDLAYAPPFSTTKDPVIYTGMILDNALNNECPLIRADDIHKLGAEVQIVDVRSNSDYINKGHVEGAINIPHAKLRDNLDKLNKDKPVVVYCNKGVTGNAAQNILINNGFKYVYNLSGGQKFYKGTR